MSDLYWKSTYGLYLKLCWIYLTSTSIWICPASGGHLKVSAPHMSYICPEGASVKMECVSEGSLMHPEDSLRHMWLFTPHQSEPCHDRVHPRNANHTFRQPPGLDYGSAANTFWITLTNVSSADQGRYCCVDLDIQGVQKPHIKVLQRHHSHILLTVTPRRNGSTKCAVVDQKPPEGTVAAGLATAGCIMGILSLPLILLLVYKQRQSAQATRRAQEMVRMDSEARGHENPVFLGEGPATHTRTVSQILARQSSETGRHLLSDPGTPLSPPAHGDMFFPSSDPIPESPEFLQV